jgi:hypothetical protein
VVDHPEKVFKVKAPAIDEEFTRPDEVNGVLRLELPQHGGHGLGEGFWFSRHNAHGPILYILRRANRKATDPKGASPHKHRMNYRLNPAEKNIGLRYAGKKRLF